MKLSRVLQQVTRFLDAAQPARPSVASPKVARPAGGDGFEVARPAMVNLGQLPPASAAGDADFVKGLYRDLLGREPDAEGFYSHMKGLERGMSREEIRQVFLGSPEYREKSAAANSPAPSAPAAPAAPEAPAARAGDPARLGPVPLEGFDNGKLADPNHNTVKYLFGRVATHYPLDQVKDKASAEALLNRMVPDLRAAGLDIRGVKGDKLLMKTPLGLESIDVVRGSGSGNPGWWWGADGTVASAEEISKVPPLAAPTTPTTPTTPTVPTTPPGTPVEPGAPLSTVPFLPEYASASIDKSSPSAAALSAARWAKDKYPDLFARAGDRQVCYEIMTKVVGALRAAGFDATRVVNHPDRPVGDGWRYGSDAVVVNGTIFDVFGGMGESNNPQALDAGPYEAGRLRE